MKEPTFDKDGYPTEETLIEIRDWPHKDKHGWFEYAAKAWYWPDMFKRDGDLYKVSTGGWSGNESVINAMQDNKLLWILTWVSSERGGHYVFEDRK